MYTFITGSLFYLFSLIAIFASSVVVLSKNPVHSVLFLILAFFSTAGIFILIGAEFIAMTLIIVYVGAVAVLFLFVIMMLDINMTQLHQGFLKHLPVCILVAVVLLCDLLIMINVSFNNPHLNANIQAINLADQPQITNTHAIGSILYTDYILPFQLAGLILLAAMIGAIVLTLRKSAARKKQDVTKQLSRTRTDSIELVKINKHEGVDGITH